MEKIIITGGKGFLGKKLEKLLRSDYEIFIFDKPEKDITSSKDFENLSADCVVHLAALTRGKNQGDMLDVNVHGTLNVLEFCKSVGARFIFASSAAVYGNKESPIQEETELNPVSFYGLTKLLGEKLCCFYKEKYGIPTTILRIFNLYGEGQQGGFVIQDIFSQLEKEKIVLKNPLPKRDFIHVEDVAESIRLSLERKADEIVNIGSGKSYSIREIAEKIAKGKEILYSEKGEKSDIYANISKAKRVLGWAPRISLDEGLKKFS